MGMIENNKQTESKMAFEAKIFMNRAFEKAARTSCEDFSMACIHALAEKYGFGAEEAVNFLGLTEITVKKSATRKKGEGKVKSAKSLAEKISEPKRETPSIPLPWTGVIKEDWCCGLRLNHGLHSQCTMERINGKDYCKTCQKQADRNSDGKPTYGCVMDRMAADLMDYKDPKTGKLTLPFANVMNKLNITREAAEAEASKFGLTIPEEHFVERSSKRGRPKKDASASDSESSQTSEKSAKKRGRPKKEKKVVSASIGDDLIATLVAQSSTSTEEKPDEVSSLSSDSGSETSAKVELDKAAKKQKKAEKIQQLTTKATELSQELGRSIEIPSKLTELSTLVADLKREVKQKKRSEKANSSKLEEARKKAAKEAAAKEAAEKALAEKALAEKAAKEAATEQTLQDFAIESEDEEEEEEELEVTLHEDEEEEEEEELEVTLHEHEGKTYLKSKDNMLYDQDTQDTVGLWNPESKTITYITEEDSDEESDEDS